MTPEAKVYEAAKADFGSYANFREFEELVEADYHSRVEYHRLSRGLATETEILEHMEGAPPYFMDPFQLRGLPLFLLGVPDGSAAHRQTTSGGDLRGARKPISDGAPKPETSWLDYTDRGWPSAMGNPRRIGTSEEHAEIERRLKTTSLTMPGSAVSIRGQSLASLFEENIPEPAWIIEGLLRQGGALMVYGESGIGKSWLVHTLMLMASHGRSVGIRDGDTGELVLKAGDHESLKVALIDGEMIKADILSRCRSLCTALGLKPATSFAPSVPLDPHQLRMAMEKKGEREEDIAVWVEALCNQGDAPSKCEGSLPATSIDTLSVPTDSKDSANAENLGDPLAGIESSNCVDLSKIELRLKTDQDAKAVFPDLSDPSWKARIIEFVRAEDIKVLVLDNLATLSPSLEDENKATAWAPFNDLVVALKHIGVATIIVHHSGKGGSYRGSSNLMTTLENSVQLSRVEGGDEVCRDARFKVEVKKNRGHQHPAIDGKVLRLSEGKWQVEIDEQGTKERVLRLIRSCHYIKQSEVAEAAGLGSQGTVSKLLKGAYILGDITEDEVRSCWRKAKELRAAGSSFDPELDRADGEIDGERLEL